MRLDSSCGLYVLCHQAILTNKLLVVAVYPFPKENLHSAWCNFNY